MMFRPVKKKNQGDIVDGKPTLNVLGKGG